MVRLLFTDTRLVIMLLLSSIILVALMGVAIQGERGFLAMWRTQRDVGLLALDLEEIERGNVHLRRAIHRLQHDDQYIERLAREELGLLRDGELLIEFVEPEQPSEP